MADDQQKTASGIDSPIVSVIVPIYNASRYLARCLDSILAQSYSKIEVLLVDDGSTDGSGDIADQYGREDERVTVFHKPNSGVSDSRNFGLLHANGEWITFVDSDDTLSDRYLECLLRQTGSQTDFCLCNFEMVSQNGNFVYETFKPGKDAGETLYNLFMCGWIFCIGILFRKSFLEKNFLSFPTHINYTEDVWFLARAIYFAKEVSKTEHTLYYYNCLNGNSITHLSNNEKAESIRLMSIKETIGFLKSHQSFDVCQESCYWRVLVWKSWMVYFPEKYPEFNLEIPEANRHIWDNPFLSKKMKLMLWLISHHCFFLPKLFAAIYKRR